MTARTPDRRRAAHATKAAAAAAVLVAALSACSASHPSHTPTTAPATASSSGSEPPLGYRSLPSFLPSDSTPVDRVVTASAGHPQLAVQGVGVRVRTASGAVLATVTGPHVPPFTSPPPPAVTAVFDISLARATGTVPVRVADFTITDQLGRRFHPALVAHEAALPPAAPAGRTLDFRVTAVMPTGEGRIYWTPAGGTPTVAWDFVVEND